MVKCRRATPPNEGASAQDPPTPNIEATQTRRSIAVLLGALSVLLTIVIMGTTTSALIKAHEATSAPSSYGGGRLMAVDPDGGYWTSTTAGLVTAHGGAPSLGSPADSGIVLARPIVGMAATRTAKGIGSLQRRGVFTFGDAPFYGSGGSLHLNEPIVGMAATRTAKGIGSLPATGSLHVR